MTDNRIEKIRAEIERRYNEYMAKDSELAAIRADECLGILSYIDSMQEEPTTSVWHDTRSKEPIVGRNIVMLYYNHIYSGEYLGERFFGREKWTLMSDSKWAYVEDLLKL
jgi:hypothetical protein